MTSIEWAIGHLVGSYGALGMSHPWLSAKLCLQAERIIRWTDDIERMAVSLGLDRGEQREGGVRIRSP